MSPIFYPLEVVYSIKFEKAVRGLIAGLVLIIIAGCKPETQNPLPNQEINTPFSSTQSRFLPSSTPFQYFTSKITVSPTTSTSTQGKVEEKCFKITTATRLEIRSVDDLVLFNQKDGTAYFYKGDIQTYVPLRPGNRIVSPSVSPDHKHLLYYDSEVGHDSRLVILDNVASIVWSKTQGPDDVYRWFDSQRLWHHYWVVQPDGGTMSEHLSLENPFNNFQEDLRIDFPSMNKDIINIFWSLPETIYDTSLKRVVYAGFNENYPAGYNFSVFLYDIESDAIIRSLLTKDDFGLQPIWLPDGSAFIMAAKYLSDNSKQYEFFSISRDGDIKQLTHFEDYFSSYDIATSYALSPDGRYLALWLNIQPAPSVDGILAILDLHTGNLTDYCISGASWNNAPEIQNYLSPVWSPDGEQLAIMSPNPESPGASQISLINLANETATRILDLNNVAPIGWVKQP